jgi:uncharacterized protein
MNASTATAEQPEPGLAGGTPDQPVAGGERIVALDFIRGIAVLGILFANVTAFGHPLLAYYWPEALPGGGSEADRWIWLFQFVFVDGKFRGLFTLLFGAGMYLFMERAWARGATRRLQARRLFWLMLFGIAHFYLLFIGDILFLYSVSGLVVLAMLRWTARTQLWVGLGWYVLGSLLFAGAMGSQAALEGIPSIREQAGEAWQQAQQGWQDQIESSEKEAAVVREGSYADVVGYRLAEQSGQLGLYAVIGLFETMPLMLIGMALLRFGLFEAALDRRKMRRWGWVGFLGGALLALALGWWAVVRDFPPFLTQFLFNGASAAPRLPMVLGIAALLALWAPVAARGWLGGRFVAAGRMAFSNYIGTSLVMTLVFQGWAGGLYGQLDRAGLLVVVVLAWVLMLAWSKPWLERFRYGPLEWLWRCLTYWKLFPLRR